MSILPVNKYLLSIYSVPGSANTIKSLSQGLPSGGGGRANTSAISRRLCEEWQSRVKGLGSEKGDVSVGRARASSQGGAISTETQGGQW